MSAMKTNEFERFLIECKKSNKFDDVLNYLKKLTNQERMYIMLELDSMNTNPKEIEIQEVYKSLWW